MCCTLYPVPGTMYSVSCILYTVPGTLYPVYCIMYHVSCIMCQVSCILYTVPPTTAGWVGWSYEFRAQLCSRGQGGGKKDCPSGIRIIQVPRYFDMIQGSIFCARFGPLQGSAFLLYIIRTARTAALAPHMHELGAPNQLFYRVSRWF